MSTKINIFEKIYHESKVRIKNKQNRIFVYLLSFLHLLNFFRNRVLQILKIKKNINW